ncbi:MAG: DUF1905 domain-containing protein [Acidobacteria bacterium]|nr:MAG: DUF1905 domain-containing protein [Acidobacteriota bacterium]REJ99283.1 MAG: DUF1905 domain-containing protein [Acidobacteriota bacterium]REK15996.1 MAG: DUF1905 domain-containing protein [Acidobacteriota bacterium]REK43677.1 MAG: DUF1905 domain-containing protein [Acidobacteriota bacterium]
MRGQHFFKAELLVEQINPYVVVPSRVSDDLGDVFPIPVRVRFSRGEEDGDQEDDLQERLGKDFECLVAIARVSTDGWFRTSVVRRKGEAWLFVDKWMRKAAGSVSGDYVRIQIEFDDGDREITVPDPLKLLLKSETGLRQRWRDLSPSRKKEILTYLNMLKSDAALNKNIEQLAQDLKGD